MSYLEGSCIASVHFSGDCYIALVHEDVPRSKDQRCISLRRSSASCFAAYFSGILHSILFVRVIISHIKPSGALHPSKSTSLCLSRSAAELPNGRWTKYKQKIPVSRVRMAVVQLGPHRGLRVILRDEKSRAGYAIRKIACCSRALVHVSPNQEVPGQRPFRTLLGDARVWLRGRVNCCTCIDPSTQVPWHGIVGWHRCPDS